jgi:hypothetical protein
MVRCRKSVAGQAERIAGPAVLNLHPEAIKSAISMRKSLIASRNPLILKMIKVDQGKSR